MFLTRGDGPVKNTEKLKITFTHVLLFSGFFYAVQVQYQKRKYMYLSYRLFLTSGIPYLPYSANQIGFY